MRINSNVSRTNNTAQVKIAVEGARRRALHSAALVVLGGAQLRAPVDTGRLRASLAYEVTGDAAFVGTNVEYAPHVEYGTVKMEAQPYLRPALLDNISTIRAIFERNLGGAIS